MSKENGKRMASSTAKAGSAPAEKKKKSGKRLPVWGKLVLGICALAVVSYLLLCSYVSASDTVLQQVYYENLTESLAGLSEDELHLALQRALASVEQFTVSYQLNDNEVVFTKDEVFFDEELLAQQAMNRQGNFLSYGFQFLTGSASNALALDPSAALVIVDESAYNAKIKQLQALVLESAEEVGYELEGSTLLITKGSTQMLLNEEQVREETTDATLYLASMNGTPTVLQVPIIELEGADIDLTLIAAEVETEPKNASYDAASNEIVAESVGLSLDVSLAQSLYDAAADGELVRVPLTETQPEITASALKNVLFADLLASSTTYVSGNANRLSNVQLMATKLQNYVMAAGDSFSYLNLMGPITAANGFKAAGAYVNGETVDEMGGGVCQVSSMIYYCVFHADLKVLERSNHAYLVGYIRDGLDATVYNPSPDFRFQNDTDYPIKFVTSWEGRNLTIKIYGTKTNSNTVSFEQVYSDSNPYTTVYEFDSSVAIGSVKEKTSGYNGIKVTIYKLVYDENGNLLSRTLATTNNYRRRDRVLLINPADAAQYGLEVPEGTVIPEPETPAETETPAAAETPDETTETPAASTQLPIETSEQPTNETPPADSAEEQESAQEIGIPED